MYHVVLVAVTYIVLGVTDNLLIQLLKYDVLLEPHNVDDYI